MRKGENVKRRKAEVQRDSSATPGIEDEKERDD
jgi:hypothetical protein